MLDFRKLRLKGLFFLTALLGTITVTIPGCTVFTHPIPASPEALWGVTGRLRVSAEDSILRADFRAEGRAAKSHLEIYGPFGIGRVSLQLGEDAIEVVHPNGSQQTLTTENIDTVVPNGEWLFKSALSSWLLLRPVDGENNPDTDGWEVADTAVKVLKTQMIGDQLLCKHIRVLQPDVTIDILCDTWYLPPQEIIELRRF